MGKELEPGHYSELFRLLPSMVKLSGVLELAQLPIHVLAMLIGIKDLDKVWC